MTSRPTSSKSPKPKAAPRELRGRCYCLPDDCSDLGLFEWSLPSDAEESLCAVFGVTREQFAEIVDEDAVQAQLEVEFEQASTEMQRRIEREWSRAR